MKKILFYTLMVISFTETTLAQIDILQNDTSYCQPQPLNFNVLLNPASVTTNLIIIDDTYSDVINLGFDFNFYGNVYNQCILSTNNYICFNTSDAYAYSPWPINTALPSTAAGSPKNSIFGPWHDTDPSAGTMGTMSYKTLGVAPNRKFIVSFCEVPMYSSACNSLQYSGQIILYEGSNKIETHIANKPICTTWNTGQAIHGLHNADGTLAHIVPGRNFPSNWTTTDEGYQFVPLGNNNYSISQIPYNPVQLSPGGAVSWFENGNLIGTGLTLSVANPSIGIHQYIAVLDGCYGQLSSDAVTVVIGSCNCDGSLTSNAIITQPNCGISNGSLSGITSGGVLPYSYLWSTGSTMSAIQNLSAGTYTLTVSDANGCTAGSIKTLNNSICPKVTTQSTVNNITQNTATVSWPAVSCAAKYRVVVKNVSTGTQTTTLVTAPNTSLNLSSLQANTTYQVRIRTQCSQNGTVVSQLSPIKSFTTLNNQGIQCLPPANVSTSGITASSAQINWTPATGAIQYNLRYRKVGTSTWTNTIISNGSASSITVQNLTASTAYEFQLRTKCNSNPDEFSPYSALNVFNTLAQRIEETGTLSTLIYPNPTNTNINVVINAVSETQTTIRITDLLGRVLLNETEELIGGNNTITYNISDYAAGVYLIHVGNGNTQQVFKVVKE